MVNQLAKKLYGGATAEIMTDKVAAFQAIHPRQALNGLRGGSRIREGEIAWPGRTGGSGDFGEGHLRNERLVAPLRRRSLAADGPAGDHSRKVPAHPRNSLVS